MTRTGRVTPNKACPYCGSRNLRVKQWHKMGTWFVACQSCNATGPSKARSPEEACRMFDRRVDGPEQGTFDLI